MDKQVLAAIKAIWDNDKPTIIALIQQGEGGVTSLLTAGLQDAGSKLTGFAKVLYGFVEPEIANVAAQLVAQYGPDWVYAQVDAWLAKEVG